MSTQIESHQLPRKPHEHDETWSTQKLVMIWAVEAYDFISNGILLFNQLMKIFDIPLKVLKHTYFCHIYLQESVSLQLIFLQVMLYPLYSCNTRKESTYVMISYLFCLYNFKTKYKSMKDHTLLSIFTDAEHGNMSAENLQ